MSARVVDKEKVEAAIAECAAQQMRPTMDRVVNLIGGSKSTIAPLFRVAMEERRHAVFSGVPRFPQLEDALESTFKRLTGIPVIVADLLKMHDDAIAFHYKEELAWRDAKIEELEEKLATAESKFIRCALVKRFWKKSLLVSKFDQ